MMNIILSIGVAIGIVFVLYGVRGKLLTFLFSPQTPSKAQTGIEKAPEEAIAVIAQGLTIPWEIAFLPNKDILVTQRSGELLLIGTDTVYEIEGVAHVGEGGLLGMALHPDFKTNRWLYLYFTTNIGNGLKNRVERYRFEGNRLSEKTIIISNIPGAAYHDGGALFSALTVIFTSLLEMPEVQMLLKILIPLPVKFFASKMMAQFHQTIHSAMRYILTATAIRKDLHGTIKADFGQPSMADLVSFLVLMN